MNRISHFIEKLWRRYSRLRQEHVKNVQKVMSLSSLSAGTLPAYRKTDYLSKCKREAVQIVEGPQVRSPVL